MAVFEKFEMNGICEAALVKTIALEEKKSEKKSEGEGLGKSAAGKTAGVKIFPPSAEPVEISWISKRKLSTCSLDDI